jgi:hypoxanthine-guanine phosphoribosyltransferase
VFRPDREHDIEPDFIGLPCTEFIIGYGLDFNLKGRQYCNIYQKIDE